MSAWIWVKRTNPTDQPTDWNFSVVALKREHIIISNVSLFACESICEFLCRLPIVNERKWCRSTKWLFSLILLKIQASNLHFGTRFFNYFSFNVMEMVVQLKNMARGMRAKERKIRANIALDPINPNKEA